jgi:hypothetical protein
MTSFRRKPPHLPLSGQVVTPFGHGGFFFFFHPGLTNRRLQARDDYLYPFGYTEAYPIREVCRAKARQGEVKTKNPNPLVLPLF